MMPRISLPLPSCEVSLAGSNNEACGSNGLQKCGSNVEVFPGREGSHVHGFSTRAEPKAASTQTKTACSGRDDATPHPPAVQEFMKCKASDWWSRISTAVLRSRTSFGAFLNFSIRLTRSSASLGPPAPTLFPVPVRPGLYNRMPTGCSAKKRRRIHLERMVHVMSMALNFWHSGGEFNSTSSLWRDMNRWQKSLLARLKSFIRSDGLDVEFDALHSGRKQPELIARLCDLTDFLLANGCTSNPYDRAFQGYQAGFNAERFPELQPYRDLDPSRLRLSGEGHWDITQYLSDQLVLPYREPDVLKVDRVPSAWEYPRLRDGPDKILALAKLWDANSLLMLHQEGTAMPDYEKVRIFNAYKNNEQDRQIGDRRGRNSVEAVVKGPASLLPAGSDLCDAAVDVRGSRVSITISDRRDYYHQIWSSRRRAVSNTLGPGIPLSWLHDTKAYSVFMLEQARRKKYDRLRDGDLLHAHANASHAKVCDLAFVSFRSVLQGDHIGVDLATDSHTSLLQEFGLLGDQCRLTANKPCRDQNVLQGLVIDDFFCVSFDPKDTPDCETQAAEAYTKAQNAYSHAKLTGSPQKDIWAAKEGKVIGAYINGSDRATQRGLCTVGPPPQKKLALAQVTLELCRLGYTTVGLHSCVIGAWVSMLVYRRPMMGLLNKAFRLLENEDRSWSDNTVIQLPREVAQELVLVSVLSPLIMTNIAAPYDQSVYCTDASEQGGGICEAEVGGLVSEVLFKSCRTKGAYTKLLSPLDRVMHKLNALEEFDTPVLANQKPGRPLAFVFEFIEVFSGASRVTEFVASFGIVCGPPLDISFSEEYDLRLVHVVAWLTHLIQVGTLKGMLLEPPCTTFSIMRRPALRSKTCPFGFDVEDAQTSTGNVLGHRAMQLAWCAAVEKVAAILEKPWTSLMKHLPSWSALLRLKSAEEIRTDSCQFGSIHQKAFSFLGINVEMSCLAKRCQRKCHHVPIQGAYTKSSATYVPKLAYTLAKCLAHAIQAVRHLRDEGSDLECVGLENQLVNDVVLSADWKVLDAWRFRSPLHINLLELKSLEKLVTKKAKECRPLKFCDIVDSNVSRGALGKGRSASVAVSRVLKRIGATLVASDLYMVNPFCPTRWNPSDCPSREQELPPFVPGLGFQSLCRDALFDLATFNPLRRWSSNWVRLVLLLLSCSALRFSDRATHRISHVRSSICYGVGLDFPACLDVDFSRMDFDHTLGFPGEGPSGPVLCILAFSGLLSAPSWLSSGALLGGMLWTSVGRVHAMEWRQGHQDLRRALDRASKPLQEGRPTLQVTQKLRERYWALFEGWLKQEGINFDELLDDSYHQLEEINAVLVAFGRKLYSSGKPYNVFAETLNCLSSKRPSLRRHLQGAWDLAFTWTRAEPVCHHTAMPWQILLAMLSLSLAYGWVNVAGALALSWGSLLRAGELLAAKRRDLLLPRDVEFSTPTVLLAIKEPKTRGTGAKHQAAKLDIPDLIEVVDFAYKDLSESDSLWPFSGQTLRTRFRHLLAALKLPTSQVGNMRPLDLGSLRSGGATWHLQVSEDAEYTRRKGRWLSFKVMEIYVQESLALVYLKRISEQSKQINFALARAFTSILDRAKQLHVARVPPSLWFKLIQQEDLWR